MKDNYDNEEILEKITVKKKEPSKGTRKNARIDNSKKRKDKSVKKEKKPLTKKRKIVISIIAVILILIGTVFGVYIYKANGNIAQAVLNVTTDVLGEKDPIFVLVLGVSEDISNPLTDTIILCGYNPDSQKAFMLSVPRDTFVGRSEASAGGYDKINALYQTDVAKTVTAVEKLTGISIDNYVVVKNTALPAIVNAIGEVEFDVPIDMDYDDPTQDLHIHLKKGVQKIDGDKAEQLLRFRHNNDGSSYPYEYGDNDYGRMRTQREFMKVVAESLVSWNSVTKLKGITEAVFANLETDMKLGTALGYVPYALKFDTNSIRMEQLPGSSAMLNNLWFYKASTTKTKNLVDELLIELELDDKELEKYYTKSINKDLKVNNTTSKNLVKDKDNDDDVTKSTSQNTVKNETTENIPKECEHNYSISLPDVHATCTEAGKISKKCSLCGKVTEQVVPPSGHNFTNGKCARCGVKDPSVTEHKHSYKETNKTNPTCSQAGKVTMACSCGATKTETLSATGHNFGNSQTCSSCGAANPNYVPPTTPTEPDTGKDEETTKPIVPTNPTPGEGENTEPPVTPEVPDKEESQTDPTGGSQLTIN